MMRSWPQRFATLNAKARWALMAAALGLVLFEVWNLGLREPWLHWRKAQAERLSQAQREAPDLSVEIAEARSTLAALQARAEALKAAHQPERLSAWRSQLQGLADKQQVIVGALAATDVAKGLPRISLTLKGRYADVWAVQQHLTSLDMPLQPTRWIAEVQADDSLVVNLEAMPSARNPTRPAPQAPPSHDPFSSSRQPAQTSGRAVADLPPLRALVAAGPRSMVMVGTQMLELGGLIQGYRLIEVHEDRALFVKQDRHVTIMLETPSSP